MRKRAPRRDDSWIFIITICFRKENREGEKAGASNKPGKVRKPEPAISRVLSSTTIHLGQPSPTASSNLPGSPFGTDGTGEPVYSPIWSCSGRGLPCRELLPVARCALTAPFHPYQPRLAVYFLWHFPWAHAPQALPGALSGTFHGLTPPRRYLAPCPKEPGLSSIANYSDCLANSGFLKRDSNELR